MVVVAIISSAFAGGSLVYYSSSTRSITVTQTDTVTSFNTVVQVVTSVPEQTAPSTVTVYGTVESELDYPIEVDFCRLTTTIDTVSNNSSQSSQLNGALCGTFTAPITNQTSQNFQGNQTYYVGVYSVRVPNNATYLLQVRLLLSQSGPAFEEQAGWLPLNYTTSSKIVGYGIDCYQMIASGLSTYQCSSGFS